ncbi:MAG: hypothetical protein Ct9H300mP18_09000 [Candidatus Neomarinimicrobiota bacterium]|nr:MAG: hypothetical protein Ct9H300mP18_09000 [Candidatus Neomarinimicrobiota bacterium]
MTMDENYYNYFIRGEEGGYSNFLLNSGTTSGQSVGIKVVWEYLVLSPLKLIYFRF